MTDNDVNDTDVVSIHERNAAMLGARDAVVSGYPASGSSLVGNIFLELGFEYIDPYTEVIDDQGVSHLLSKDLVNYRGRYAATAAKDRARIDGTAIYDERIRFIKNQLYPERFDAKAVRGAVLLIRDPRDAVFSTYKVTQGFSTWFPGAAPKGQGSFAEFLDELSINDEPPIEGWLRFNQSWFNADGFDKLLVVRFEDLKRDTVGTVTELLKAFDVEASPELMAQAVERSSFTAMRAHEDRITADEADPAARTARVFRRGKVNEWREWYGIDEASARFRSPELISFAAEFGYDLNATS